MNAMGLTKFGGPEVLQVVDLPEPQPGPGEVRIRVHAVAVNPTDITFRAGGRAAQLANRPPPYVPGMDVAGTIDKLGDGADGRLAVGDCRCPTGEEAAEAHRRLAAGGVRGRLVLDFFQPL